MYISLHVYTVYIHMLFAADSMDEDNIIVEEHCLRDPCGGLVQSSTCASKCMWEIERLDRFGHAAGITFTCQRCHSKRRWLSSRILGGKYIVNQR